MITRALIVKKIWVDKILDGTKTWEMRTTPTSIKGRVGLIEAGTGLIVGEVDIVGSSSFPISKNRALIKFHQIEDLSLLDRWKYAWCLRNPERYETPIPYKHPKGAVVWVKVEIKN